MASKDRAEFYKLLRKNSLNPRTFKKRCFVLGEDLISVFVAKVRAKTVWPRCPKQPNGWDEAMQGDRDTLVAIG